jgi:hypothetical protein
MASLERTSLTTVCEIRRGDSAAMAAAERDNEPASTAAVWAKIRFSFFMDSLPPDQLGFSLSVPVTPGMNLLYIILKLLKALK